MKNTRTDCSERANERRTSYKCTCLQSSSWPYKIHLYFMSNLPEKTVPYYTGNNDMQALLWGSAFILDNQPVVEGEQRKVEWTDDQGRDCELTGRTGRNRYRIPEANNYHGIVHYTF